MSPMSCTPSSCRLTPDVLHAFMQAHTSCLAQLHAGSRLISCMPSCRLTPHALHTFNAGLRLMPCTPACRLTPHVLHTFNAGSCRLTPHVGNCLQCRPQELQKLNMLAQDPRPLQEKQDLLAQVRLLCSIQCAGHDAAYPCVSCQWLSQAGRRSLLAGQPLSGFPCPWVWWSGVVGMFDLPQQNMMNSLQLLQF